MGQEVPQRQYYRKAGTMEACEPEIQQVIKTEREREIKNIYMRAKDRKMGTRSRRVGCQKLARGFSSTRII